MKELHNLKHVEKEVRGGGVVIVMDTGAVINAEAQAMLQALHSRSAGGFKSHLQVLEDKGADNFMANFYVGYGHASIGDCGTTTIFVEGISMLAAKALQDWRLYSGQEASTRYIDFESQPFIDPTNTERGKAQLERMREFYKMALPLTVEELKVRYPKQEQEKESIYSKAILARAFDVLRGFLPAGAATNIAWTTNLRQAADAMRYLRHHPLQEVRNIADALNAALQEAHPNSFGHKLYEDTENFNKRFMAEFYYHHDPACPELELVHSELNIQQLKRFAPLLAERKPKTEVPRQVAEAGTMTFDFQLDFGSFRDIQRHRAVVQRMPLLTTELGFENWYFDELPESIKTAAQELLNTTVREIAEITPDKFVQQYYIPMGYKISNRLTGDLAALIYLVELRTTRFVHITLRKKALKMGELIQKLLPFELPVHIDPVEDRFDIKRGLQTIELKQ